MKANDPTKLYEVHNGRIVCGSLKCAGMAAHHEGQTLSGGPVLAVTKDDLLEISVMVGRQVGCESCGYAYGATDTPLEKRASRRLI